jgi:hypothetical protein
MTQSSIQPWQFSGDFFESCNCEVNCPCVFGTPAHYDRCDVAFAWHIASGRYGDTALDGLNFAVVARTPKRMADGNWSVAIYIDQRATRPQRQALERIASGDGGGGFARRKSLTGTLLGVKHVPINYESVGRRRKVTIPNALTMEVEAVPGGRPGEEVKLVNDARSGERGFTPRTVAKAVVHRFSDYGLTWDNTGKNGYYAPVEMSGP